MPKHTKSSLINDYHLLTYDVIDSTNAEAKRLAGGGASHGAVIWARKQTSGRGRMGREWVSADGNLFVTVLLSPNASLEQCAQLSFVASLAVADTLEAILPDPARVACKWPNDVLVGGKKIAGILLESFMGKESSKQWVAVGVGVNVDNSPEHVMFPATSLRESGVELISAKIVLSRFVEQFIGRYDEWEAEGFTPIEKTWKKKAYRLGDKVEVIVGDDKLSGVFDGINETGQMLLRDKAKKITPISAGDVFFREPA